MLIYCKPCKSSIVLNMESVTRYTPVYSVPWEALVHFKELLVDFSFELYTQCSRETKGIRQPTTESTSVGLQR